MTGISDSTKQIARAFYESYNQKDLDASFDTYISKDLVNHVMGGAYGRDGWRDFDKTLFPAFEDLTLTVLDQIAEGNKVATRYTLGGTQTGEFFGIAPKGNRAFIHATSVDRVEGGLIAEHWTDLDFAEFLQQLSADSD